MLRKPARGRCPGAISRGRKPRLTPQGAPFTERPQFAPRARPAGRLVGRDEGWGAKSRGADFGLQRGPEAALHREGRRREEHGRRRGLAA